MYLSVVVPCMNEEEALPALVERLSAVIKPWRDRAEIVLVDDGSHRTPRLEQHQGLIVKILPGERGLTMEFMVKRYHEASVYSTDKLESQSIIVFNI